MITGRIVGVCVATRKDERLHACRLLVVEPIGSDGTVTGKPAIAVDLIGAGRGDLVMMARSRDASMAAADAPVDLAVVAIVDTLSAPAHRPVDYNALGFREGGR